MKITLEENEQSLYANFINECKGKFTRTAIEKGRTLTPWNEHNFSFFVSRIYDELKELGDALQAYLNADDNNPAEIIKTLKNFKEESADISLFAWMGFVKADLLIEYLLKKETTDET